MVSGDYVFGGHLGDWPDVYRQRNGSYHIHAWHYGPLAPVGFFIVLAVWAVLGWLVYNEWQFSIIAGIAAAVPALLAACFISMLPSTRMKFIVRLNGDVLRDGRYIFSFEESYKFQPQLHSEAENEARKNERLHHARQRSWQRAVQETQQQNLKTGKNELPPSQPGPPMTFYAGSSELFVIRGSGHWIQIAEFGNDPQARQASRLAGALEYVFYEARQDAARAQQAALTQTVFLPAERSQTAPVSLPAPDEDYE